MCYISIVVYDAFVFVVIVTVCLFYELGLRVYTLHSWYTCQQCHLPFFAPTVVEGGWDYSPPFCFTRIF